VGMQGIKPADDAVTSLLDGELRLVYEAILMVEAKGSSRVLVSGLRLGEEVLDPARRLALEHGVRLLPVWTLDGHCRAIRVEAIWS
jgi:hypothetical protein